MQVQPKGTELLYCRCMGVLNPLKNLDSTQSGCAWHKIQLKILTWLAKGIFPGPNNVVSRISPNRLLSPILY